MLFSKQYSPKNQRVTEDKGAMSAMQPQAMVLDIPYRRQFMPQLHNIQLIPSNRPRKKAKPTTMSATAEGRLAKAKAFVEKDIAEHKVVVYAKSWCPHCNATKALLGKDEFKGVSILIRDIDTIDEPSGPVLSKALKEMTDQGSVPNIFIDGKQIGGNSDIQAMYANGTLKLV